MVGAATAPPPAGSAHLSVALQLIDRIGDIVGMVILGVLCHEGRIDGLETMLAIGAILGVGTGLRQVGHRAAAVAPLGLGVTGLLILGAGRPLAAFVLGALAPLLRWKGAPLGCLLLVALTAHQGACTPAREALLAPHHAGACDPGPLDAALPSLCRGAVPYVCSRQGHLWPATPSAAPCPGGCVSDDGGARCALPDAATPPPSADLGGAP